jgi:hypothetical protein
VNLLALPRKTLSTRKEIQRDEFQGIAFARSPDASPAIPASPTITQRAPRACNNIACISSTLVCVSNCSFRAGFIRARRHRRFREGVSTFLRRQPLQFHDR